jgi:hypothetical protein
MKANVVILAVVLACSTSRDVSADYDPPPFEAIAQGSTAIVDATVLELTSEGHAKLKIHRYLKGKEAPATLTGIFLTCDSRLPRILKAGTRYILCIRGSQLFEELTYYPIRERDGRLECHYRDSRSGIASWMTIARFAEKLETATQDAALKVSRARNAHETVEAFLNAVREGEIEEALSLHAGGISEGQIVRLQRQLPEETPVVAYAVASASGEKQQAFAVATTLKVAQPTLEEMQSRKLVFALVKTGKRWKVLDVQFKAADAAHQAGAQFQAKFPDAKPVRPRIGEGEDILDFTSRDYLLRQAVGQSLPVGSSKVAESKETVEQILKHIPRPWTVSKVLEHYDKETNLEMRCHLLNLLALSLDPRGAVVVGEALNDRSVQPLAAYLLLDTHMPMEASIGGTEQHIVAAHKWWAENQARLRAEAEELAKRRQNMLQEE